MKKLLLLPFFVAAFSSCINKEAQERQRFVQDSIEAEQARLDSINNLGIWKIEYYVDDFGDQTNHGYVSTEVNGTFSNSATTDSRLRVRFVIDTSSIRINLYEYGGNHPIKGEGFLYFKVKGADGDTQEIQTNNDDYGINRVVSYSYSDYDKILRSILYKGGEVRFKGISDRYGSPSEYNFTITNADHLEKALNRMVKSGK